MRLNGVLIMLLFTCAVAACAQEPRGKIVFFREHRFSNSNFSPPVYCDGVLLGRVVGGTYLEVSATAGTHRCVADAPQLPTEWVSVPAGGIVYFHVEIKGDLHMHGLLAAASESDYLRLKAKLEPLSTVVQLETPPVAPPERDAKSLAIPSDSRMRDLAFDSSTDEQAAHDEQLLAEGEATFPKCISCPNPDYPESLRKAKFDGSISLRVLFHADGRVAVVKLLKSSGLPDLDKEAVATAETWHFNPALNKDGMPIDFMTHVEFTFRPLQ